MSIEQFHEHCQSGVINGFDLRESQTVPETYNELVLFMTDRVGLVEVHEPELGVEALSHWLMGNKSIPDSCSPDIDTEHVSSVILIGELTDRDRYVATLPFDEDALALPPPSVVRALLESQS